MLITSNSFAKKKKKSSLSVTATSNSKVVLSKNQQLKATPSIHQVQYQLTGNVLLSDLLFIYMIFIVIEVIAVS